MDINWRTIIKSDNAINKLRYHDISDAEAQWVFDGYDSCEQSRIKGCMDVVRRTNNEEIGIIVAPKDNNYIVVSCWKRKLYKA